MCKYCEMKEKLYDTNDEYAHIIKTSTGQYGIEAFIWTECSEGCNWEGLAFKIEFCPKCGEKLY